MSLCMRSRLARRWKDSSICCVSLDFSTLNVVGVSACQEAMAIGASDWTAEPEEVAPVDLLV